MLTCNTGLDGRLRRMVIWPVLLCDARAAGRSNGMVYVGAAATVLRAGARRRGSVWAVAGIGAAAEAVVDGLTAFEAGLESMPVLDGGLAEAPAEKDDFVVEAAGKIEESGFEIFDLNADGVDLRDGFADAQEVGLHFGAQAGDAGGVDAETAGQIDALGDGGESGLDLVGGLLGFLGALEQRLKDREE